jgi:TonB-dependent SusC/RagA subfamily outer membrane receptor
MESFMYYCLKAGLILTWFWVVYQLFLQKETFYRFNRFFLLTGMAMALLLPLYTVHYTVEILPVEAIAPIATEMDMNFSAAASGVMDKPGSIARFKKTFVSTDLFRIGLPVAYITGVGVLLFFHLFGMFRLIRIIRKNKKQSSSHDYLIESIDIQKAFSFSQYVFLPGRLSEQEKMIILKHEATHIRQKHRIDLLFTELLTMLWWFNPIIWLYGKAVRNNHEYLADKAVLKDCDPLTYRQTLINQWVNAPVFPLVNSFSYTNQVKRINMTKKNDSNPIKQLRSLLILPGICLLAASFAEPRYMVVASDDLPDKSNVTFIGDSVVVLNGDETENAVHVRYSGDGPLIFMDGEKISRQQFNKLIPDSIQAFSILKDSAAIKIYGEEGKNGVILIKTKSVDEKKGSQQPLDEPISDNGITVSSSKKTDLSTKQHSVPDPIIFIDEKKATRQQLDKLIPNIQSFSILKDSAATKIYGEDGKNGVILIKTKLSTNQTPARDSIKR